MIPFSHFFDFPTGVNPGLCFANTLTVGKSYVVYLRKAGQTYLPSETEVEVIGANDPFMQNITSLCGLRTMYPEGNRMYITSEQVWFKKSATVITNIYINNLYMYHSWL